MGLPVACLTVSRIHLACCRQGLSEYVWIRVDGEGNRAEFDKGGINPNAPFVEVRHNAVAYLFLPA